MTMTNRQRGDYFERQVMATLKAHGWVVYRSAGSHGAADLVAGRYDRKPVLIQCKISGRIDPAERTALLDEAEQAGWRAVVALRPKGGRVQLSAIIRGYARLVPIEDPLNVPPRRGAGAEPQSVP
jgi:Holliday junction resolvase